MSMPVVRTKDLVKSLEHAGKTIADKDAEIARLREAMAKVRQAMWSGHETMAALLLIDQILGSSMEGIPQPTDGPRLADMHNTAPPAPETRPCDGKDDGEK